MKFSVDSKDFALPLNKCSMVATRSNTYKAIQNVLIRSVDDETIAITATDKNIFLTYYCPAQVEEHGEICVEAAVLAAFVSARAGKIDVKLNKKTATVKSGSNRARLNITAPQFFPVAPIIPQEDLGELRGEYLNDLLFINNMADDREWNSAFGGTLIVVSNNHLYSMATNKARVGFAWTHLETDKEFRILTPKQVARIIPSLIFNDEYISIRFDGKRLFFVTDRFWLTSSQLAGEFPYSQVVKMAMADRDNEVTIDGNDLQEALKVCSTLSAGSNNKILKRIFFSTDYEARLLTVSTAKENEIGDLEFNLLIKEKKGEDFEFVLYSDFLNDILIAVKKASELSTFIMEKSPEALIRVGQAENKFIYITSDYLLNAIFIIAPIIV